MVRLRPPPVADAGSNKDWQRSVFYAWFRERAYKLHISVNCVKLLFSNVRRCVHGGLEF